MFYFLTINIAYSQKKLTKKLIYSSGKYSKRNWISTKHSSVCEVYILEFNCESNLVIVNEVKIFIMIEAHSI